MWRWKEERLDQAELSHFFSVRCVVSSTVLELANTRMGKLGIFLPWTVVEPFLRRAVMGVEGAPMFAKMQFAFGLRFISAGGKA